MASSKNNWLSKLMQTKISAFTGFMLLFSSAVLSTNAMPEPTNEHESVFFKLLTTSVQQVKIQEPEINLNALRIKVLTRKLEKKEKENSMRRMLLKKA